MSAVVDLGGPDPVIDALSAPERESIAFAWETRAVDELAASALFDAMHGALARRETAPEVLELVRKAVAEERTHSAICLAVAERHLGRPLTPPVAPPVALPEFVDSTPELDATLHVLASSCVSETVAVEFLRVARAEAKGLVVREALRLLMADEIRHARLGWAHLASSQVTERERASVARILPALLGAVRHEWTRARERVDDTPPGHGFLPRPRLGLLFDDVVRTVVVPGLLHVGISVEAA